MVALLALAHDCCCEAELATVLSEQMDQPTAGTMTNFAIDLVALRERFSPKPGTMPAIVVTLPPVASYDMLLSSMGEAA